MALTIQQDPQELRDSLALNSKASFGSLRLVESRCWAKSRFQDVKFGLELGVEFRPTEARAERQCLQLGTQFTFFLRSSRRKTVEALRIECRFEAEYQLKPGYKPSDAEIGAFHRANAVFNCWPFFREYIQNTAVRMNYPAPPIPFLRLRPKPTSREVAAPTKAAAPSSDETVSGRTTSRSSRTKMKAKRGA
jgi:hypothetical protein